MTRNDKKAIKLLREGCEKWFPNLRFLTLTCVGDFAKNFRKLKRFLKKKNRLQEYFGVRTGEGFGVIHLVFTGKSVRYADVKKAWVKITQGAWAVSISKVRDVPGIVKEMTRQHRVIRYFHSEFWIKPHPTRQADLAGVTPRYGAYRDNVKKPYFLQ